jgi:hypothetical protein
MQVIADQRVTDAKKHILSTEGNLMQKSSSFNSPSAKSAACHRHDLSFP